MNERFEGLFCLSIRQPWAWLILHAGKDIENRNWPTRFRGRVLIHAGKAWDCNPKEWEDWDDFDALKNVPLVDIQRGGIVGSVEIVDCVQRSDSRWFGGPYGFVLRNPKPLPFIPCKGALGFFELPQELKGGE